MAGSASSNVISLERRANAARSAPAREVLGLLNPCRDQLAHGVATAFSEGMTAARDRLFDLADRATSIEVQTLYFAAQRTLDRKGNEILELFRTGFTRSFDASLESLAVANPQSDSQDADDLSLVENADFERDLTIARLASRALYGCSEQLTVLDRRIASILEIKTIHPDANPLFPRAVFEAFLHATEELEIGGPIGIALLQEFERQVQGALPKLYAQLNTYLIERGVLPKIPRGAARRPEQTGVAEQAEPAPSQSPGTETSQPGEPAAEDVFAQLASRFQPAPSAAGDMAHAPVRDDRTLAQLQANIYQALTHIQREGHSRWALPGVEVAPSHQGMSNILWQIRDAPLISEADPLDSVTAGIVAALFDQVLGDRDIPLPLREQLARLQVPVLKVALMDKQFFASPQHPARRLLDIIASASVGWSEADAPRLHARIQSVVDEIVRDFDTDLRVFSAQPEKLEAFVNQEEQQARGKTQEIVRGFERGETVRHAEAAARARVERYTETQDLPPLVREFLNKIWRPVLTLAYAQDGESSRSWRESVRTMGDLVWSVARKADTTQRHRFFAMLPGLLQRLHDGMHSVKVPRRDEDAFFSHLARLHASVVGPESKAVEASPQGESEGVLSRLPASKLEAEVRTELGADIAPEAAILIDEPTEAVAPAPAPVRIEPTPPPPSTERAAASKDVGENKHLDLAKSLEVGAWVEFSTERGNNTTLRLNWVSGLKNIFMFTNRQGENALAVPVDRLAERLREGSARVLSGDALTKRAFANMLHEAHQAHAL
jgi:hypothetical protein